MVAILDFVSTQQKNIKKQNKEYLEDYVRNISIQVWFSNGSVVSGLII
jgi:hypothetical protein